jgi:hypothetical protein
MTILKAILPELHLFVGTVLTQTPQWTVISYRGSCHFALKVDQLGSLGSPKCQLIQPSLCGAIIQELHLH